ncbi:hypothetical protein BWI15_22910 [Kribbella sp. ALI-6-A]|uniref:hypothetical protein n=1 Tax=Kribbella sp. ALI-6-A TaxID=1933817 RepID=UPI00097BFECD|nr:hypothetical protein [Kribbella sp. ALI-6-A]ONI69433.1 hypothetical protein BWI15_22910 [Kribbella sp. ALI-6-A]
MKTLVRWGGVLLILMSAWVAVPAAAGGPTSVLLSAPAIQKVVATGYDDARYGELLRAIGTEAKDHPDHPGTNSRVIRATWLIHDMSVWRIDHIYPDAEGGPWVSTQDDHAGAGGLGGKPVWHPAADGPALMKVLGELGLLSRQGNDSTADDDATADNDATSDDGATPEAAVTDDVTTATTTTGDSDAFTGWRWAIPGAVVGALLALLAGKLWPRRRWELVDQE